MARQTGIKGNQASMRGMKTRAPRASRGTANATQQTSARQRAQTDFWKRGMNEIEAEMRRSQNRHKFSTRADVEARARKDYAAGKIKRGELGKTIERRWKAAKNRREKFQAGQKEKRSRLEAALRERSRAATPAELGLGQVSAAVSFRISSDVREVVLNFPATMKSLQADAREAAAAYMAQDSADVVSVRPIAWGDL